jgi:hypothetical protein
MADSLSETRARSVAAPGEAVAPCPETLPLRRDESLSDWAHVGGGICVAGGAYPTVALVLLLISEVLVEAVDYLLHPGWPAVFDLYEVAEMLLNGAFFAVIGGVIGVFWTGIVSLIVVPLFYLFVRSMQLQASMARLGATCGGLVGFLAIGAVVIWMIVAEGPPQSWPRPSETLLMLALGPCLTTVLGQAGGAWGGWGAPGGPSNAARRDALAAAGGWRLEPEGDVNELAAAKRPLFQFRIRHLLWLTVWLGLFLAAASATGHPFVLLAVFGVWLVYQAATLYIGARLLRLVARWRAARRLRRCT